MWEHAKAFERESMLKLAIEFTGNDALYGAAMIRVTNEYPFACEHNLTEIGQNRRAWIGHAACYMEHSLPESIVREAWGMLTEEQRIAANLRADHAIELWESVHAKKDIALLAQMEIPGIWGSDTGPRASGAGEQSIGSELPADMQSNHAQRCGFDKPWISASTNRIVHGTEAFGDRRP